MKKLIPLALLAAFSAYASTPRSPELDTLEIARTLKPIPDDQWKQIAGDKATEKYDIVKDDTLWDISKRLFGDARYWPKIWALNNRTITNPHLIHPGNSIVFLPGTGTSLPTVAIETADSGEVTTDAQAGPSEGIGNEPTGHPPRAAEWKKLPKQEWESVELTLPPQVDPLGFDSRSRIKSHGATSFDLPMLAATQKLQTFGMIFGAEKEADIISLSDLVFIHSEGDLQVGQSYSITAPPEQLSNELSDREGWAYPLLGKVKILQQREGAFVGIITNAKEPIYRGSLLLPLQPQIPDMTPIPGPSQIEGIVMLDRTFSTNATSQHKFLFVDRGSDDGVSPGMVFRSYERMDPNNNKRMTRANAIVTADILIVQSSAKFSTGLVITSYTYISEGANAVLLTDVSDLLRKHDPGHLRLETTGGTPPDELDSLDNGAGLKDSEKRELKQLEKWKENPTPAPSGEIPPPTAEPPGSAAAPPGPPAPPAEEAPPTAPTEEIPPPPSAGGEEIPPPPSAEAPGPAAPAPTAPTGAPAPVPGAETAPPPPELPPPASSSEVAPPPAQGDVSPPPPPAADGSGAPSGSELPPAPPPAGP